MQPSAKWKGLSLPYHGLNVRTGAANISDSDFTNYPPFTELNNGQQMGENADMFWLYDTGTFPLNSLIDDWSICYTAVDSQEVSLNNIGVFTMDIDNPTYATDKYDNNGIMFYSSNAYMRIANNIPSSYGTPQLNSDYRFYCPPYNNSRYVWTPNADGARSSQGYLSFYGGCNVQGYAMPYKTFGVKSLFLEIRVRPTLIGSTPLPVQDYSLKSYMELSAAERADNPIGYAYARVHRRGNIDGTYTADGNGYDINAAITIPFHGNGYQDIGAYFNSVYYRVGNNLLFLPLFGNGTGPREVVRYHKQNNTADMFYGYDKIDNRMLYSDTTSERQYRFTMAGTEENAEYLRKSCAAYGLFFCEDIIHGNTNFEDHSTENTRWTDENMFLGIIEEDGYTRGRYTHGAENANQRQFNWTDSTDSTYDPAVRPDSDPNRYETSTPLPSNRLTIGAANCWTDVTLGSVTPTMIINNAIDAITDLAASAYTDETDALTAIANQERLKEFGFQEPLQTILDYRRIFLSQPHQRASSSTPIILGRFTSLDPNKPFVGYDNFSLFRRETLGSFTFWKTFKNFLDFEPYTQASLYVPFCGMKQLPMNIFMGHTVNIYLNACNLTGELEVLIFVDNMEWGTMQGIAAEELPLTATNAMTAAQEIRNLQYQQDMAAWQGAIGMAGSIAGASISASNRNPTGLIAQGVTAALKYHSMQRQTNELQYKIDHTKPEITAIQKGAPTIESINVLTPFILLQTPVITGGSYDDVKKKYGKTKGFKCCVSGNLGEFSGLTVCSTANLDGISCTYTEKQMILEALQEGIILDWE